MTAIPPSRYKVVERGRRLVVIDTRTGQPATRLPGDHGDGMRKPAPPSDAPPIQASAPHRVDDPTGAAVLTTSPFYDLKGPRRIVMDERFNALVGKAIGGWLIGAFVAFGAALLFAPWLIAPPFVLLFQPKVRAGIRQWITARLDAVQAAS